MARMIDAGSLRDNITDIYGGSDRLIYLADVLSLIDAQPTLTPPNDPLPLDKLQAELEKAKAERDAAVSDMEALMWFSGEGCRICAHAIEVHKEPYVRLDCNREKGTDCCPKWRGKKED